MSDYRIFPRLRKEIEDDYASILAPYATLKPKEGSRELHNEDNPSDNRSSFQRDRDRIIHSCAFRRLMYKTQVFVNQEGDHFRTRLTHTLEVSQIARGVCKSLALNEELAEAIALGHDLGHPPFGHAVERYIDQLMKENGESGFYHNEQSVRIVDKIEKRDSNEDGLDLTYEIREGILKHNDDRSGIYNSLNPKKPCSTLEGQAVAIVDSIAYLCHDLEDCIKPGILEESIRSDSDIELKFKELESLVNDKLKVQIKADRYGETFFIRKLIHELVNLLTDDSCENLIRNNIFNTNELATSTQNDIVLISFSEENKPFYERFKKLISNIIYGSQTVAIMDTKAVKVIKNLFSAYMETPKLLPPDLFFRYNHINDREGYNGVKTTQLRVICDYVSGMTDRFALEESEKLFNPSIKI